jgi:hypothetical protein
MVFALEQAVESLLKDLHEDLHEDRVTCVEAARILEEMSLPYMAELHDKSEDRNGR